MGKKVSDVSNKRIVILTVFLFLAFLIIIGRLFFLQVVSGSYYQSLGNDQHSLFSKLPQNRGEIKITDQFAPEGFLVATNVKKDLLFAVPKNISNTEELAGKLAPILGLETQDLVQRMADKSKNYVVLKRQLTDEQEKSIKDLKVSGLGFDPEIIRYYPEKNFLSHVLGFVGYKNNDRLGLYGLEKSLETQLAGNSGSLLQDKDVGGAWIFGGKREMVPAKDGDNLILTIDRSIQYKAETILNEAVTKNLADSGCIIVMNPKTGAVLAMASFPSFDPNLYSKVEDPSVFNNIATIGNYEPGSIFKAITMAASINEGKVGPDTTYYDSGEVNIDGYTIKNSDNKAHGQQTMTQVLEESLNTGVIFAKEKIGNQKFMSYIKKFGFGKKTGIDLTEASGNLENLKYNIAVNYDTASFGQGLSVTPIQMVQAFSAFANGGVMVRPYIVQARISSDGGTVETKPEFSEQVISPTTAGTIGGMLVNVVENGHGKRAKVKGYYVAGKTGTAQVPKKDGKGYEENNNIGSFIGFAPVEDPKFVAIVRINHPRTVQFAESTAAPAFGELAQFILNYYNVPPTRK